MIPFDNRNLKYSSSGLEVGGGGVAEGGPSNKDLLSPEQVS